ncbi:hypothetical protein V6N11_001793 [Hibiscus sabdariffa]|uniref:Uncharacterized protein n=1 Tax=Hibiscus sabdariffa TaxID=183260 RepID=A0ABR2QTG5_9ROSI
MSSAANPRDPSAGNDLMYPGGRPPDNVPTIPDSAVRERSVSPLRMGDDRMMKKGRTEGFLPTGNIEKQGTDVETNSDTVIVDVEANSTTFNEPLKDSYASKVKDSLAAAKSPPSFLKDEAQDSTDKNTDVAISESSLFGPWMVVADRRRRGGTARSGGPTNVKPRSGSRFESLVVEDIGEDKDNDGSQELIVRTEDTMVAEGDNVERVSKVLNRTVTKNAAYRESNPSKKYKLDTRGNKSLGSKKDMNGAVQIIEHDTGLKIGDHKAVSVIEDDSHDTSRSRGAGQRKKTNLGKGIVDVSRSKLLLRRNHGGRNADSIPLMDFTSRLSSDLDMIHTRDGSSGSRAGGHLIDHEAMLQSSDEDASYRSDSQEVLPEGAMFADD